MVNDITILTGILTVFILSGFFIAQVNDAFPGSSSDINTDSIASDVAADMPTTISSSNIFVVLGNVLKLMIWDPADSMGLPAWLDLIYTILFIVGVLIIARNAWIGGGG